MLGRNISVIRREIKRGIVVQRKTKSYISKRADDPGYTVSNRYFADIGHWEGDSEVGKGGNSSVLTLVERKTGRNIVLRIEAKTANATYQALCNLKERLGDTFERIFRSITFDNGSEFAASEAFETLGIDVYYAHPYSAWEHGQNEQFNGMLRRFTPNGKDLSILM